MNEVPPPSIGVIRLLLSRELSFDIVTGKCRGRGLIVFTNVEQFSVFVRLVQRGSVTSALAPRYEDIYCALGCKARHTDPQRPFVQTAKLVC